MTTPWLRRLDDDTPDAALDEERLPSGGFLDEVIPDPIYETADEQRQRIVAEAEIEAERIKEEARAEGLAAGREDAALEIQQQLQTLRALYERSEAALAEREAQYTRIAADFAVQVARELTSQAVAIDEDVILTVVSDVLSQVRDESSLRLTVSPGDEGAVKMLLESLGQQGVALSTNPDLARGDCLLETKLGEIQASTALALDRIQAAVERAKES